MKKKRLLMLFGVVYLAMMVVMLSFMAAWAQPKVPLPERLTLSTHSVGTTFYAVGSGLAKVASDHSGMTVVVSPTGGPPAWVPLMNKSGIPEIGIISSGDAWQAYTGKIAPAPLVPGDPRTKSGYEPGNPNLRCLMMGTSLSNGFLIRADSPMKRPEDMRGKRLTWGYPGFPANIPPGLAGLAMAGLTIKDVEAVVVPEVVAGVRALTEGRADIAIAAVGMGIVAEADAKVGVRFLPESMDPEAIKIAQKIMPGIDVKPVAPGPAGVKVETPIKCYGINIVASVHMPDHVAYALVKTWWDYHKELWPIHAQLKGWAPELFIQKSATIPYHPGAIKFYKEKGVWKGEQERWQEILLKGELPLLK